MGKLFDYEHPFLRLLSKISDLFVLNLMTLVLCLPIVTIGASITAAHYTALKLHRGESYVMRSFWDSFKENFKQSTIIWIIFALFFVVEYLAFITLSNGTTDTDLTMQGVIVATGVFGVLVLCIMMIPTFATQIPQYILFSKLGITNTWWIWVFEAIAGTPYIIFLCRQYLNSIPSALMEAATIDGCNQWQLISKMAIPMSKPLVAIVAFRLFNLHWGDYMTPYMYLSREKWPLIMALFNTSLYVLPGTNTRPAPVVNAAALVLAIPTIILFFLCQKQLQQGSVASGIKG